MKTDLEAIKDMKPGDLLRWIKTKDGESQRCGIVYAEHPSFGSSNRMMIANWIATSREAEREKGFEVSPIEVVHDYRPG